MSANKRLEQNNEIELLVSQLSPETITEDHKSLIRKYSGSGGMGSQGASGEGILHEYYTPDWLAQRIVQLAKKYGFTTGKVLEPSIATGELIRPLIDQPNEIIGFEINPISAKIASLLYPGITVYNEYFETAFLQKPRFTTLINKRGTQSWLGNDFDLVIGNPPFGIYRNQYSGYFNRKLFKQIEIFFIYQSLHLLKSGGLLAFIQSSNFLSNGYKYQFAKDQIGNIADLVDAYRLPKVFAHTDVPTDIMILRKK